MRREWTKDYEELTGPDGKKSYIYTGDRYEQTPDSRRIYRTRVMPLMLAILMLLAAMGLIDSSGSRVLVVALPWAAACFAAAIGAFDLVRILPARRALTARDHGMSALRLKRTLGWMLALAALTALCGLLHLLLGGFAPAEAASAALAAAVFLCALLAFRAEKGAVWKRIPSGGSRPPQSIKKPSRFF